MERGFDKTAAAGMKVGQLRVRGEVGGSESVEGIEVEAFSVHQQVFEQSPENHRPAEIDRLGSMAAEHSGWDVAGAVEVETDRSLEVALMFVDIPYWSEALVGLVPWLLAGLS